MNESQPTKSMVKSTGAMGPVVALLAMYLNSKGIAFGAEDQQVFVDAVYQIATYGGMVIGILGRLFARNKIDRVF